jgi:hypothetical protein
MPRRYFHVWSAQGDRFWLSEDGAGKRQMHNSDGRAWDSPQRTVATGIPIERALVPFLGSDARVEQLETPPGSYYPRIYRPEDSPALSTKHSNARDGSVHAARVQFGRLRELLQYIEPRGANLKAYGHATRDLLVLACTEVETGWKAVLRENGYKRVDHKQKMVDARFWNCERDYVNVVKPMRLHDWEVTLMGHPHVKPIRPFAGWAPSAPPRWYKAHNAVKHDRERDFSRATLRDCIEALAGVFVMVCAQFGTWTAPRPFHPLIVHGLSNPREQSVIDTFCLTTEPPWALSEYYAPTPYAVRRVEAWKARRYWA